VKLHRYRHQRSHRAGHRVQPSACCHVVFVTIEDIAATVAVEIWRDQAVSGPSPEDTAEDSLSAGCVYKRGDGAGESAPVVRSR
jgi:hypothetical protein